MGIAGRVAVVTGGGQGIGEAVARILAGAGARVVVADVNVAAAQRVTGELQADRRVAMAVQGDVSRMDGARQIMARAAELFGPVEILVNNAGIVRDAQLVKMAPEAWDAVIGVNLMGTVNCTRAAAPYMKRQRYGKIVNLASRSLLGNFGQTNYAASKAGIVGFTKSLAAELGPFNINVNAIAPGVVETPIMDGVDPAVRERARAAAPLQRLGQPVDIAQTVLFLVSGDAHYITGQCLFVCGGRSVKAALEIWA